VEEWDALDDGVDAVSVDGAALLEHRTTLEVVATVDDEVQPRRLRPADEVEDLFVVKRQV
jgi:hypothetical protein